MAHTLTIQDTATLDGRDYSRAATISADGLLSKIVSIAPAKTGTLTTRTSDTAGTLTMASGHGITTGARIDIYFAAGERRGAIVGTVAGDSVPFGAVTPGAGDVLPAQDTAITAAVPQEESFAVDGDDIAAILWYSASGNTAVTGVVVIADTDDAELDGRAITAKADRWDPSSGATNPVAGDAVAKAFFSHGSSTETVEMRLAVLFA